MDSSVPVMPTTPCTKPSMKSSSDGEEIDSPLCVRQIQACSTPCGRNSEFHSSLVGNLSSILFEEDKSKSGCGFFNSNNETVIENELLDRHECVKGYEKPTSENHDESIAMMPLTEPAKVLKIPEEKSVTREIFTALNQVAKEPQVSDKPPLIYNITQPKLVDNFLLKSYSNKVINFTKMNDAGVIKLDEAENNKLILKMPGEENLKSTKSECNNNCESYEIIDEPEMQKCSCNRNHNMTTIQENLLNVKSTYSQNKKGALKENCELNVLKGVGNVSDILKEGLNRNLTPELLHDSTSAKCIQSCSTSDLDVNNELNQMSDEISKNNAIMKMENVPLCFKGINVVSSQDEINMDSRNVSPCKHESNFGSLDLTTAEGADTIKYSNKIGRTQMDESLLRYALTHSLDLLDDKTCEKSRTNSSDNKRLLKYTVTSEGADTIKYSNKIGGTQMDESLLRYALTHSLYLLDDKTCEKSRFNSSDNKRLLKYTVMEENGIQKLKILSDISPLVTNSEPVLEKSCEKYTESDDSSKDRDHCLFSVKQENVNSFNKTPETPNLIVGTVDTIKYSNECLKIQINEAINSDDNVLNDIPNQVRCHEKAVSPICDEISHVCALNEKCEIPKIDCVDIISKQLDDSKKSLFTDQSKHETVAFQGDGFDNNTVCPDVSDDGKPRNVAIIDHSREGNILDLHPSCDSVDMINNYYRNGSIGVISCKPNKNLIEPNDNKVSFVCNVIANNDNFHTVNNTDVDKPVLSGISSTESKESENLPINEGKLQNVGGQEGEKLIESNNNEILSIGNIVESYEVCSKKRSREEYDVKDKVVISSCGVSSVSNLHSDQMISIGDQCENLDKMENDGLDDEEDMYLSKRDEISICFDTRNDKYVSLDVSYRDKPQDKTLIAEPDVSEIIQKHIENDVGPPPTKRPCLQFPLEPIERPLEVFVSSNASENADNNDPRWQKTKELTSDELRYAHVRKQWNNVQIPNINENMSVYNWRARNGMTALTVSKHNADPYYINQDGSVSDVFTKNREFANHLFREKVKALEMQRDHGYSKADDRLVHNLNVDPMKRSYFYSNYRSELDTVHSEYTKEFDSLMMGLLERISSVDSAEDEVKTVSNFYKGLDSDGGSSRMRLTPHQLACWFDREDTLNHYNIFYS